MIDTLSDRSQIVPEPDNVDVSISSLADKAYTELKWLILSGQLKAGYLHNEAEVSALTGFGKAPVRAALSQLKYERLVEIHPRKGFIIRPWNLEEVRELLEARRPIEMHAVELAAERATDGELEALECIVLQAAEIVPARDGRRLMVLDHRFHCEIAKATHNQVIAEVVLFMKQRSYLFWYSSVASETVFQAVQVQHETTLAALLNRDGPAASKAMAEHLSGLGGS